MGDPDYALHTRRGNNKKLLTCVNKDATEVGQGPWK